MTIEEQLGRDEGRKSSAYQDQYGYWTIGIGTCVDATKGCGITDEEMDLLLANRIAKNKSQIQEQFPWTTSLDEARFGVLLNMSYQLGMHGLGEFRQFLAALQQGDYEAASAHMLDSKWAKQDSPDRAQRLSEQIKTGVWV